VTSSALDCFAAAVHLKYISTTAIGCLGLCGTPLPLASYVNEV
jgi:hypothetical protein